MLMKAVFVVVPVYQMEPLCSIMLAFSWLNYAQNFAAQFTKA